MVTVNRVINTKNMSLIENDSNNGNTVLTFEEWQELYSDKVDIELAESGADRELDFDLEQEYEVRYNMYLSRM